MTDSETDTAGEVMAFTFPDLTATTVTIAHPTDHSRGSATRPQRSPVSR
jgi:hypothetical protein